MRFDDSDDRGNGDFGESIGAIVENHLGDGGSDFTLLEGRRRFVAGVEALKPSARRPWWSAPMRGLVPATVVVGAVVMTVGIIDLTHRGAATPVVKQESPASAGRATRSAERGAGDHAAGEVIRLETSREQSGATVQLISGATVTLSQRTRGQSRRVAAKAYRVNLDYGEMAFTIDPHIGSTWSVQAGAYDVRVVGTIFTVKRDVENQSIEVRVDRGRVTVSGANGDRSASALGDRTIVLQAGGTFRGTNTDFSIDDSAVVAPPLNRPLVSPAVVSRAAPPAPARSASPPDAPHPAAPTSSQPGGVAQSAPTRRLALAAGGLGTGRDWTSYYSAGDYPAAWRAARAAGYDHLVVTLDVTGLAHLADAARLSGDRAAAHDLLLAVRRRFPGSREAANAAFLLGRSAADKAGELSEASTWLQTYLAERPTGVYAEEARGRLMVVHQRAGHGGEARRAARDYLGLYPAGAYATVARALSE